MELLLDIIGQLDNKFNKNFGEKIECSFLDRKYIYTLPEYKKLLLNELLRYPNKPICLKTDYIKSINQYFTTKISLEYILKLKPIIDKIDSHNHIEQKSLEWITTRKNIIPASEAGYLLGITGASKITSYIKSKCIDNITQQDSLQYAPSIIHGNTYESVSRMIYESRNKVIVKEYGLITTDKNSKIGASPDGIVIKSTSEDLSRIGRLVEIKNPYSWSDTNDIKPEYAIQILQQQYVLDIPVCDFVKTHIIGSDYNSNAESKGYKQYTSLDDMLNDIWNSNDHKIPIPANDNIPKNNLSSLGTEKGILIKYKKNIENKLDSSDVNITSDIIVYPITEYYDKLSIQNWIDSTIHNLEKSGISRDNIIIKYWYLAEYHQKTYIYNRELYENNYLPRLNLIWKIIEHIREINYKHGNIIMNKYLEDIIKPAFKKPTKFYSDITNHKEICQLLESIPTLYNPNTISTFNLEPDKSQFINSNTNNQSLKKQSNTKTKAKAKIIIELDF